MEAILSLNWSEMMLQINDRAFQIDLKLSNVGLFANFSTSKNFRYTVSYTQVVAIMLSSVIATS